MTTKDEDWKARAQAAEAELADRLVKIFDNAMRDAISSNDPGHRRIGKMLVAAGELLSSSVPLCVLGPALEKWTEAMAKQGVPKGVRSVITTAASAGPSAAASQGTEGTDHG